MKTLVDIIHNRAGHWVGDGFPVRSLFGHQGDTKAISPFLLFDYAGRYMFEPNDGSPRGVGEHPHRGFERGPSSMTARSATAIPPAAAARSARATSSG